MYESAWQVPKLYELSSIAIIVQHAECPMNVRDRALEAVRAAEEDRAAKDAEVEQLTSQLAAASADQQRLTEVESEADTLYTLLFCACVVYAHPVYTMGAAYSVTVRACMFRIGQGRQALHSICFWAHQRKVFCSPLFKFRLGMAPTIQSHIWCRTLN